MFFSKKRNSLKSTTDEIHTYTQPLSDIEIYEKICEAWNSLDVNILEPYLADDLYYDSLYWDEPMNSKKDYLEYLTGKFQTLAKSEGTAIHASIEEENSSKKPFLNVDGNIAVFDVVTDNGFIQKMLIRKPLIYTSENIAQLFPKAFNIAVNALDVYFQKNSSKSWGWMQTFPPQIRFQDLCIAYDQYVLSIMIGVVEKTLEKGFQISVPNQQEYQNLLRECETNHLTPCLFLIDSEGNPFIDGCHLNDARSFSPLDLDNLQEDNEGRMSEWEIQNIGVSEACQYLASQGYTDISYCDIPAICPQIYFKDKEQVCYAIVRSVANGLAEQKFTIKQSMVDLHLEEKGYFIDIRWSWLFGGSGLFNEKFLYRGAQLPSPERGMQANLMHNNLELVDINKAVEDLDFIEYDTESTTELINPQE